MKMIAFSLLDMKTGHFNTPFFMTHPGQAIRAIIDLGQDLNTTVGRHPADFVLCQLGGFDDQTGAFDQVVPQQLGTVASYLPATTSGGMPFFAVNGDVHDRVINGEAS
jgi:hypothetical protein